MADSFESNATHGSSSTQQNLVVPALPQNSPISVKLADGNFLMWEQQVEANVWGYGMESHLTGEERPPPQRIQVTGSTQMVSNPEYIAWKRQDQRLAAWLLASLSESAMVLVIGLKTSKEIWDAIQTNFANQSMAKIMQHRLQIQTMKKEGLSMKEYLAKMKSCFDILGSAGSGVAEHDQILYILGGLGHEYDPMVASITTRVDPWTVKVIAAVLLSFEARLIAGNAATGNMEGSQPSLHLAQQSVQKRSPPFQQPRGGISGNFGRGNGRGYRGRGGRSGFFSRIVCQLCEKSGYTASKCWQGSSRISLRKFSKHLHNNNNSNSQLFLQLILLKSGHHLLVSLSQLFVHLS